MKFSFRQSTKILLIFFCISSAYANEPYKGSEKYGIKVSSKDVYKYIADFGEFSPRFWNVIYEEYDEYPKDTKVRLRKLSEGFRSELEEQLMGNNEKETKQALRFYEDTYRLIKLYREILSKTDPDLLFELMQVWEKGFREHIQISDQSPYRTEPLLALTKGKLTSAGVADPTFSEIEKKFETVGKLYSDITDNTVMVLLRNSQKNLAASPKSVRDLGIEIDQAVQWSFVSQRNTTGPPSIDAFRGAINRDQQ